MVLCPYIFLLLRHDIPPLTLQPTEVHSAHWVSLHALFAHSLRTYVNCDVSERLNKYNSTFARYFLRLLFGKMRFSATQLMPTDSLWCSSSFLAPPPPPPTTTNYVMKNLILGILEFTTTNKPLPLPQQHPPLILWGLTLGMIADFLGPLFSSSGVPNFWTWPTFSSWDYRLAVWLFTWAFRAKKLRELRAIADGGGNTTSDNHRGEISTEQLSGLDGKTFCANSTSTSRSEKQAEEKEENYKEATGEEEEGGREQEEKRISVVGEMLDGYFDRAMLAAALVLFFKLGLTIAFLCLVRKYQVLQSTYVLTRRFTCLILEYGQVCGKTG